MNEPSVGAAHAVGGGEQMSFAELGHSSEVEPEVVGGDAGYIALEVYREDGLEAEREGVEVESAAVSLPYRRGGTVVEAHGQFPLLAGG